MTAQAALASLASLASPLLIGGWLFSSKDANGKSVIGGGGIDQTVSQAGARKTR